MRRTLLRAPSAVIEGELVADAAVLVEDGLVRSAGLQATIGAAADAKSVAVDGVLLPGLVDLQVNGMGGRGCQESEPDALDVVARAAWNGGAAAFLPTLITASIDTLCERAERIARWIDGFDPDADAAVPLGIHLEGPFLESAGAHDASLLVDPEPAAVDRLIDACGGHLRLVTLAPGRQGAAAATARFRAAGATVSVGHAESVDGFAECVAAGAGCATHLFNVMSPLHHRDPGVAALCLDEPRVTCCLIADGVHVHRIAFRIACAVLGTERAVLVTDAADPAGMPDGEYALSGMPVTSRGGVVHDREGRLAGSALTIAGACAFYLREVRGADARALAAVAARNPARLAGAGGFGTIRAGAVARFAVLAADGTVCALRA